MIDHVELSLALLILLAMIAVNISMFISLGKQGDERRKMIVEKASSHTFAVIVLYILFCVVEGVAKSAAHNVPVEGMNPLITLTVIAIIYSAHLLYYKRKFGD